MPNSKPIEDNTILPQPNPEPTTPPAPPEDDASSRIKKDMHKYKDEAAKLRAELEEIKMSSHKAKEDWKTVAEIHESKAKEFEQKFTGLQSALVNEKKIAALTIEAQKHGLNPASLPDLELLDFEEVNVETTSTGKIMVSGQDRAIARLKTLRPHWFNQGVPSVNPSTPNVGQPSGQVTLNDVQTALDKYNKSKSESDKKAYSDLILKYKSQGGA